MKTIRLFSKISALAAVLLCGFFAVFHTASAEPSAEEERRDYVIDLTNGYYQVKVNYPGPEYGVFSAFRSFGDWFKVPYEPKPDPKYGGLDHVSLDLDRDGTFDVMFQPSNDHEYGSDTIVVVPLPGGSIDDRITLQGTEETPFRSVTFILNSGNVKAEYPIKIQNGKAVSYTYDSATDSYERKEYTSAAPGTQLVIEPDDSLLRKGTYLKEWSGANYAFPKREDNIVFECFVMPAHDVSATPVMADQTPHTINLAYENTEETRNENWYVLGQWDESDCFFASAGWTWDTVKFDTVDINGDGIDDIYLSPWKSTSAIRALPVHSIAGDIVLDKPNAGPYWPITVHFTEPAMTLNLGDGMIDGNYYGNGNTLQFLRENLKPFELPEKPGYYDIDRDGQADIRILNRTNPNVQSDQDEYALLVLENYSLGATYTVPAAEGGFPKPVTLKLTEKPKYYSVTLSVSEGGTVTLYEQEGMSTEFSIGYGYENPGTFEPELNGDKLILKHSGYRYSFIPCEGNRFFHGTAIYARAQAEPGYRVKSIEYTNGEQTGTCLKHVITMTGDVTVTAVFEKIPEATPTPTYTPTPSPSPKPTATSTPTVSAASEPTASVTKTPTESPESDSVKKFKRNVKWVFKYGITGSFIPAWILLIIIPVFAFVLIAAVLILFKKQADEPESEQEETTEEQNKLE